METVNVGLLGVGTVGSGVVKILTENSEIIKKRLGFELNLKRVYAKKIKDDVKPLLEGKIANSYEELLNDDIDIVVELIGGTTFAKEFILEAIEKGKSIATANKALLAEFGYEIFSKAFDKKVDIGYEAAVAGGIPIIKSIKESLAANNIHSIKAIVNGTCNYILTEMFNKELPFDKVLKDAQEKGFAEADPTFDIDGIDSAHKMAILSSISFGDNVVAKEVYTEGIRNISLLDIKFADEFGYRIKLLGITRLIDDKIDVRVHPTLIKKDDTLAKTDGEFNAIKVRCDMDDETIYIGKGAGSLPTASAVVGDIMDIARNIKNKTNLRVPLMSFPFNFVRKREILNIDDLQMSYYLRFTVKDQAGVLSKISGVLGDYNISIKSVVQINKGDEWVPLIMFTHKAREADIKHALSIIEKLDIVKEKALLIRVDNDE
ncbi:homoserine dehydrogenase [Hippea alviniae]|uniref:homoserine dehydrogenase n=1 Tax=Hippea alviniae TaxID=1279027 RepID=UPI0003B3BACE|nr:homoserine dehydrogenase [Hippea alviniae]